MHMHSPKRTYELFAIIQVKNDGWYIIRTSDGIRVAAEYLGKEFIMKNLIKTKFGL